MKRKLQDFPYKSALVLGLAKSGMAAANVLLHNNIYTIVNDYNGKETDKDVQSLITKGADVVLGSHPLTLLDQIEVIVKNPGIPYSNPLLEEALHRNIPIITEVELASLLVNNNPIIGITGSNGKTTTTMLAYDMLQNSEKHVKLAGNIGVVASEVAESLQDNDSLLLELSSFQLMGTEQFHPHIAVLLNLFGAHLDYHGTIDNYEQAKMKIVQNQTENDYFVYNADDERIALYVNDVIAKKVPFSTKKHTKNGAYVDSNCIYYRDEKIIDKKDIVLVGEHNISNVLAAICIAKLSGATNKGIVKTLSSFSGVEHRLQFVGKIQDRYFYNDSKATNKLATEKALQAFSSPIILLAGGLERGENYDDLIPSLKNVKAVILFGETKNRLKDMAEKANIEHIVLVENVTEAVPKAVAISDVDDVILLSPACASWDQYKTFEERGNKFIQAIKDLQQ